MKGVGLLTRFSEAASRAGQNLSRQAEEAILDMSEKVDPLAHKWPVDSLGSRLEILGPAEDGEGDASHPGRKGTAEHWAEEAVDGIEEVPGDLEGEQWVHIAGYGPSLSVSVVNGSKEIPSCENGVASQEEVGAG